MSNETVYVIFKHRVKYRISKAFLWSLMNLDTVWEWTMMDEPILTIVTRGRT